MACTSAFWARSSLGQRRMATVALVWGVVRTQLGLHSVLGQQRTLSGLCVYPALVQQQREGGSGCAGTNHWCAWSECLSGLSARWSTCTRGGLRQLSGQWISAETDLVSIVWLVPFQTLPSTDCVKCVWGSGPLLHDGAHREQNEGGRESWLDGFSTSAEQSRYTRQSWQTRTRWRRGQCCGGVAFDCFKLEDDGNSLVVWSPSFEFIANFSYPCILYFRCLEEGHGWVFLFRPTRLSDVPCLPHAAWGI